MKFFKIISIILAAALALSGCEETESGNQPSLDSDYIYNYGMCQYQILADESIRSEIAKFDNVKTDPFYEFVIENCNPDTPEGNSIDTVNFTNKIVDINEGDKEVSADVYTLDANEQPLFISGAGRYTDLEYVIQNRDSDGLAYDGRIIGKFDEVPFDIVFKLKPGWKNEGFFVRKQIVSDGSGFFSDNFLLTKDGDSPSENRNTFFENDFISKANRIEEEASDFHQLVFSACDLDDAEKIVYLHNSNKNLGGGIAEGNPVTSTFSVMSYSIGFETMFIDNIALTTYSNGNVRFDFDLQTKDKVYEDYVLTCFVP